MFLKFQSSVTLFIILLAWSSASFAFPSFLSEWQAEYSTSTSADNGVDCQLCHQRSGGGNGWNSYGWMLREHYIANGRNSIRTSIRAIENADADADASDNVTEITNVTDVILDKQPGWRSGANNTIHCNTTTPANEFCDGDSQLFNQLPPDFNSLIPTPITRGERISLETIASGFSAPNLAIPAPGIDGFLFVVDQPGIIWKVNLATGNKTEFLNVSSQIVSGGERGLLGLAFHPQFASNGLLYTYQSEAVDGDADFPPFPDEIPINHQSIIAEWSATLPVANAQSVNLASKRELLRIDQPQGNHNGGMIAFGPDDLLYISLGDGGSADDQGSGHSQGGNAQDTTNPLGSMLRIDPIVGSSDGELSANEQYRIPSSNVFVTSGTANDIDEIYAYGLRNVFRFSFDSAPNTGDLYAADVGQNDIEEVSFISSGQNMGWPQKEGSFFFDQNGSSAGFATQIAPDPEPTGLSDPFIEYDHDEGNSVIGGYIYRGNDLADFNGRYIFGDLSGRIFYTTNFNTIIREFAVQGGINFSIFGFGQDADGEMYVLGSSGELNKLVPATNNSSDDELCFPIKAANNNVVVICL